MHGAIVRPPHFDASHKYPTLFLIHGGPQGAWEDSWTYRWNSADFRGAGYVIVMINPRGSTGYGQKFTDEITDDWGGKVYDDLMKGLDYAIANYKFIDADRVGCGGRLLWRLHGGLDRRAHRPLQGADQPRRAVRQTEHVWRDGRAVV